MKIYHQKFRLETDEEFCNIRKFRTPMSIQTNDFGQKFKPRLFSPPAEIETARRKGPSLQGLLSDTLSLDGEQKASVNLKKNILPEFQSLLDSIQHTPIVKGQKLFEYDTSEKLQSLDNENIFAPSYLKFENLRDSIGSNTVKTHGEI